MPQSAGAKFREALQSAPLMIPGVFNAFVAKMAERIGFQAAYQSGAVVSAGNTGIPDICLVNQIEFADQARLLTQGVDIPVISDVDDRVIRVDSPRGSVNYGYDLFGDLDEHIS